MDSQVSDALTFLRTLATPAEIGKEAARHSTTPAAPPKFNSHIHLPPNFSAFESVEQAIALAKAESIQALGVSNYYDFDVYGEFAARARTAGIFPLFGLEIIAMQNDLRIAGVRVNDPGNPGKTYVCGKAITRFDKLTSRAAALLSTIRKNDSARMVVMADRMSQRLIEAGIGAGPDEEAIVEMIVERHGSPREQVYLQERHISQAIQEAIFAKTSETDRITHLTAVLGATPKLKDIRDHVAVQNELRSHLMKAGKYAFVEESFLSFEDASQLVRELGGIPCYPVLADGTSPLCEFEADKDRLIESLLQRNIYAAEWIPGRNRVETVTEYVTKMRNAGILVTAGTEHNTLDLIPLEVRCKDGDVPAAINSIFWEGACVVAAHQFLTLNGECGYVDEAGRLASGYSSADERIRHLAAIGASVIGRYRAACCR